ncbi:MAG TPA: hypothetical protein VLD67_01350, partial [Vicinamibacterales bacterium]|nr:hypothetical protein [Vicinamibacterales bacterium]
MSSAASAPDVLALIAPNGLGHLRRQVGILSRLLERVASIRVHVLCADAQMARIRDWERAARFFGDPRVTRTGRVLDPGVTWSTDTAYYKNGSLVEWLDRLSRVPDLERARLVVSDNLAGVLAFRSDAILAGSFLWGDVLMGAHAASEQVRDFAAAEDELLARHRPPMLCVKDVAMPAVVGATRAVRLEWMCDDA